MKKILMAAVLVLLLGTFSAAAAPAPAEEDGSFDITVSFTGDMLLASLKNQTASGNFNAYANQYDPDYFLQNVKPIFEADDFTVVNLENVFTDRKLKEREKNQDPAYWFRSRTSNVEILTCSSVEAVSLAGHHVVEFRDDREHLDLEKYRVAP